MIRHSPRKGSAAGPSEARRTGSQPPKRRQSSRRSLPRLGQKDVEALQVAFGEGTVSIDSVATRLSRVLNPETEDDFFHPRRRRSPETAEVVVEGQDDMLIHLARCCSPVPGDPIVGYVTVGRGVSVHPGGLHQRLITRRATRADR